ncbi:MAG: YkvA family protein [Bacteroidota bacterium]|nr:YkvA family protein [Bacteroidota bacterium]
MKNNNIVEEEIFEEIEIGSSKINKDKLGEIIPSEKKIYDKSSKLEMNRFSRFIKQIKLAIDLLKDFKAKRYTDIPWRSIAMIAAGVLYFINPFDMVPDMLPLFGIADDAMLFATVFKSIQIDLEKYGAWKGISTSDYF